MNGQLSKISTRKASPWSVAVISESSSASRTSRFRQFVPITPERSKSPFRWRRAFFSTEQLFDFTIFPTPDVNFYRLTFSWPSKCRSQKFLVGKVEDGWKSWHHLVCSSWFQVHLKVNQKHDVAKNWPDLWATCQPIGSHQQPYVAGISTKLGSFLPDKKKKWIIKTNELFILPPGADGFHWWTHLAGGRCSSWTPWGASGGSNCRQSRAASELSRCVWK